MNNFRSIGKQFAQHARRRPRRRRGFSWPPWASTSCWPLCVWLDFSSGGLQKTIVGCLHGRNDFKGALGLHWRQSSQPSGGCQLGATNIGRPSLVWRPNVEQLTPRNLSASTPDNRLHLRIAIIGFTTQQKQTKPNKPLESINSKARQCGFFGGRGRHLWAANRGGRQ